MSGLLDGIKVIDFSQYAGPWATLRLQDWGAEVIKIESPTGDMSRHQEPVRDGFSLAFKVLNRGKSSICVDLKNEGVRQQVYELVKTADVVVEANRPGVTKRLGIDYETLSALNPAIVYCSFSGFGQDSVCSSKSGHDLNYMALSGMLAQFRDAGGRPVKPKVALADFVAGVTASESILAGLVQSQRTGKGCYLDISMTESVATLLGLLIADYSENGTVSGVPDEICYNIYETRDGRYVTVAALEDKFWMAFCEGIGHPELIPEKAASVTNNSSAYQKLAAIIKDQDFVYWQEFFVNNDCCFAPVLGIEDLIDHPLLRTRGLLKDSWGLTNVSTHFLDREDFASYERPFAKLGEDNRLLMGDKH
jgi:crotonobetainyl-CoA:carnitine CoA-transferase CaiB-like acyl-CoA transferase